TLIGSIVDRTKVKLWRLTLHLPVEPAPTHHTPAQPPSGVSRSRGAVVRRLEASCQTPPNSTQHYTIDPPEPPNAPGRAQMLPQMSVPPPPSLPPQPHRHHHLRRT